MSFILEAIRRSEEARHKRLIPDVSTIHAAPRAPARTGSRTLQAPLVMGLALALLVAAGWAFYPWLRQVQEAGPQAPAAAVAPTTAEGADRDVAAAPDPGTATGGDPAPAPAEPAPTVSPSPPSATPSPAPAPAAAPAGEAAAKERRPRGPYSSRASSDPVT
ncbi:MAG TPA: hypothetical protein VLR47_00665, partial [Rhodospirillales bacterium]|nr:hypothetical protein [Rhodospirillales bacterium]